MTVFDNRLFVIDNFGNRKMIDLRFKTGAITDLRIPFEKNVFKIMIPLNNNIFACDFYKNLYCLDATNLVEKIQFQNFMEHEITDMIKYKDILLIADRSGNIRTLDTISCKPVHMNYSVMDRKITKMCLKLSTSIIYITDNMGYLKSMNVETNDIVFDYGKVLSNKIKQLVLYKDSLFVGAKSGYVKCISTQSNDTLHNFGEILTKITQIIVCEDKLFIGNSYGKIKILMLDNFCSGGEKPFMLENIIPEVSSINSIN